MTWNGAGAWPMFSQARQVNFSRTCWITFHCRGTTSSVSVTSSPILASRSEPQQAQAVGPGTMTRSRGRCSGNGLRPSSCAWTNELSWRSRRLGHQRVLGRRGFELLELQFHLVEQALSALGALAVQRRASASR